MLDSIDMAQAVISGLFAYMDGLNDGLVEGVYLVS